MESKRVTGSDRERQRLRKSKREVHTIALVTRRGEIFKKINPNAIIIAIQSSPSFQNLKKKIKIEIL